LLHPGLQIEQLKQQVVRYKAAQLEPDANSIDQQTSSADDGVAGLRHLQSQVDAAA
jgi:hypothetical protein